MENVRCRLTVETPAHIGSERSAGSIERFWDDQTLYVLDPNKLSKDLFSVVFRRSPEPAQASEVLTDWIAREAEKGGLTFDRLLRDAIQIPENQILQIVQVLSRHRISSPRHPAENSEVALFMRSGTGFPYVPGSEIKGAVRTALLYHLIRNSDEAYRRVEREVRDIVQDNRRPIGRSWRVNPLLAVPQNGRYDPKWDLMKLVLVGDSDFIPEDGTEIGEAISVNMGRPAPSWAEFAKPSTQAEFSLGIDENERLAEHLGLSREQRSLLDLKVIFSALYEFSRDIVQDDIGYFEKSLQIGNARVDGASILEKLNGLQGMNTPETPIIRLGRFQGFLSTTVGLAIRERDPALYSQLAEKTPGRSYPGEYPKTRRLLRKSAGLLDGPLGWCRLELLENQ